MQTVLLVIHLLIAAAMVGVVLMQQSEGGALGIGGGGGGGGGFLTGRGTANLLTRATAVLAACFFLTSILLTIVAQRQLTTPSAFDTPATTTSAPAGEAKSDAPETEAPSPPSDGSILDKLKRGEGREDLPQIPQSQ